MNTLAIAQRRMQFARKLIRRIRRSDPALGMRVEQGQYQIVRVTYDRRGRSAIEPKSNWRAFH